MNDILVFNHHAMAAEFQVRLAGQDGTYARQAAQAAFALVDGLEAQLSRFQANSDVSQIAQLAPGEMTRISEPVFACLEIARQMESSTVGAFSITAAALRSQPAAPKWTLLRERFAVRCDAGKAEFDLGAIGKGFALDRMAEVLREWSCQAFLLVAGGSSILAGDAPAGLPGWSCGLGGDAAPGAPQRFWLERASLGGSGLAVKGAHILDPRTGQPAHRIHRAWALCDSAAESDALSTACMVLSDEEIVSVLTPNLRWLAFFETETGIRHVGLRPVPQPA